MSSDDAQQYSDSRKLTARARLNSVTMAQHPARLRVTEPDDVFLALTSYPPGDEANEIQLAAFRKAIADVFEAGNGVLEVEKESALFLSRKVACQLP
jgi:hypothetical protein